MIGDLVFRVEAATQQRFVALRDRIAGELEDDPNVTLISANETRQDRRYFVAASMKGASNRYEAHQIEVDAMDEADAIAQVAGPGTVVIGVSEVPMAPPPEVAGA